MKIAILGAGAFGTALGGILADNGYDIDYYDPKFEKENLSQVIDGAKYVVLCAPSGSVSYLLPYLPKNIPLVIATKGILSDAVFRDFSDYMIISGPGFAKDIKAAKETWFTITDDRLEKLFKTDYVFFDKTKDSKGVLMCGALKNVYAIQAGLLGLERESSAWQRFIRSVLMEMREVLEFNGASGDTVDLVCGIADLELTCGYPSRNFEFGDILRKNPEFKPEKTVEGFSALKRIRRNEIMIPDEALILKNIIRESETWG